VFFTLDRTPKPNIRESLLLPVKSLNTLVKKKPYYKMVFIKETELKKKINSNVRE